MSTFQERLIEAMSLRGINAAELSRLSGVNEGAISQYKKGKYKANQHTIEKLARCLDVSIPWLMGVSDVFGSYESNLPQLDNILPSKKNKNPQIIRLARLATDLSEEDLKTLVLLTESLAKKNGRKEGSGVDDDI